MNVILIMVDVNRYVLTYREVFHVHVGMDSHYPPMEGAVPVRETHYRTILYLLCVDDNECAMSGLNSCAQDCVDIIGSFLCFCRSGYLLDSNAKTCSGTYIRNKLAIQDLSLLYIDINECSVNNGGCDHSCTNVPGSYSCSCNSGYTLNSNQHGCTGIYTYTIV